MLSNRHQAIVKTKTLHALGILDKNWKIKANERHYKMVSPTFLIDGIYKSMEGPKSSRYIQLSTNDSILCVSIIIYFSSLLIISVAFSSIFENANHFLAKSLSDAPM